MVTRSPAVVVMVVLRYTPLLKSLVIPSSSYRVVVVVPLGATMRCRAVVWSPSMVISWLSAMAMTAPSRTNMGMVAMVTGTSMVWPPS